MHGSDPEAQVRAELEQIMPLVSALTGLPTRWSGVVELVGTTEFKGKKRHTCGIQLASTLVAQEARWTTLIHECLHAVSAGYSLAAYQSVPGWEEGVVEQLQRMLRDDILARVGVSVPQTVLAALDADHGYNGYIHALEKVRFHAESLRWSFTCRCWQRPWRTGRRGCSWKRVGCRHGSGATRWRPSPSRTRP